MKGKNLQTRLVYPVSITFRFNGEFKCCTDKQKLREFNTIKLALQQMLENFSRQKIWEKKKTYKIHLKKKNEESGNKNYLKWRWIEYSNQKTQTGWIDMKSRPMYILSTRDPLQT